MQPLSSTLGALWHCKKTPKSLLCLSNVVLLALAPYISMCPESGGWRGRSGVHMMGSAAAPPPAVIFHMHDAWLCCASYGKKT
eukprot:2054103-Amphidinium_carterae.1